MSAGLWNRPSLLSYALQTKELYHNLPTRQLSIGLGLMMALCAATIACAQSNFTRIFGPEDQNVPTPTFVGTIGEQDASAVQEITEYRAVVNAVEWAGLQATGTFTDSLGNGNPATLTIVGTDKLRLDVTTPNGTRSTRISGALGSMQKVDGTMFSLPPITARGGLLAFPRLLAQSFPDSHTTIIDDGQIQINGSLLHRITFEVQAFSSQSASIIPNRDLNITDLYFDPATHLLIKSVSSVQVTSADRERYLIVVTYGDYQTESGALLPLSLAETVNGQPDWTLHLSTPNFQPSVDGSYFHF